jgi:ELWxxDGT repeat protein
MKHPLHLLALMLVLLTFTAAQSQVTQLSNNTNIQTGAGLGSIGILTDSSGNLWVTDGTASGTTQYTSKVTVDSTQSVVVLNGKAYFAGISATTGSELWVTDGTDAGTILLKDIRAGNGSSEPRGITIYNNAIYFFASTVNEGIELWKSDGTSLGTTLVKDINPGTASSYNKNQTILYVSNNILYFNADDGTHGTELWKTDGTTAGTVLLADINPGAASSNCAGLTPLGATLFFSANDGTHGTELWKTDGTTAGTVLVADLANGGSGSSPQQFVAFQNKMFFLAFVSTTYKLFSSDGTTANTVLVKSFAPGAVPLLATAVIINNKLYFSNFTITSGLELWSSDGTTAGTVLFKDINPGGGSSGAIFLPNISPLIENNIGDIHTNLFNGKIFFIADDGTHGTELWITDGTDAGTQMVKDINPGAGASITQNLAWFYTTSALYFAATDGASGDELYKTDGTLAGTSRVADINPGAGSSDPMFLYMYVNSHIYFTADNGDNATGLRDLYILDESVVLPVSLIDFAAAFNGKTVDLKWATATETNTKNFSVQRSYDAVHFQTIGTVNAAGNSVTKKDYSYNDASALNGSSTIYYRLLITDKDGKSYYSKIASIQINAAGNVLTLYPNPVKDRLNFITGNTLSDVQVKITDQSGKVVLVQKINSVQQGVQNTIDVSNLAKGVYHLQLITTTGKQTSQFVKF